MKKLILFGTGPMAEVAHFYFSHDSNWEIAGFTEDNPTSTQFQSLPVFPLHECSPNEHAMFVAVGYSKQNQVRSTLYHKIKALGFEMASYISSKSTIWTDQIGEHCFILENQVIQPFVRIGNNVVLWSGNHIGHHSEIEDHCFIASHVVVSGQVKVGAYTFIGVNASLRDGICIGDRNVIGAAATIMSDTLPGSIYRGPKTEPFMGSVNL